MNEENIKRIESRLAVAYKEGHYKEDLEKILSEKPGFFKSIARTIGSVFNL
ncbi:MAG: hypothetical protein K5773_04380 [Pseudobutyrivibrio sp.]|nr:hypothetical protein [Pseudobutyrivibrio sp.]